MDVSDLFVANPVVTFQDTDLFYVSVDDGGGGYDSGAFTWATMKLQMPTLYTANGSLEEDRTVDMADFTLLFNAGMVGVGAPGISDVVAGLHVWANDERTAFGVGEFTGVEPLLHSVFAMPDGAVIAMVPEGSDIANASNYRMIMGLANAGADWNLGAYNGNDLRIQLNTATGGNLLELYDSLGSLVAAVDESSGSWALGAFGQPVAFEAWGNIGFNTNAVPQPDLSQGASPTFGGAYTAAEQALLQAMLDALLTTGIFKST